MSVSLLISVADPCPLNNVLGEAAANIGRPVTTKRVDDNDLAAPLQAFQTIANTIFFVVTNNDCGNLRPRMHYIQIV
jgi:hypothetical protein